jgi:PTH1 family peptidyl-tRNA hydrolase
VVGLGNPGPRYSKTRHNIGFLVVEELAARIGAAFSDQSRYRIARGSIKGAKAVLMEPITFMNLSGDAVVFGMRRIGFEPSELILIHDDLDLPVGRVKLRIGGGAGGHKGVLSVIERTGEREFLRVKIGIGKEPGTETEHYVLQKFSPEEHKLIKEAVITAADAVEAAIAEGAEAAMNRFNRRQ